MQGPAANPSGLTLILPARNEAATIRQAIREAQAALAATVAAFEIVVVDDGSTDETAALAQAEADADPHVRLVRHPHNRGYGAALRSGFEAARFDRVAFTDANCQFDLFELTDLLALSRRYDIVCGYRIDRQDTPRRRFFSWGYNTLVTVLMGSPVRDIDCAFKVFRRDALRTILPESTQFFVNTEMLTRARLHGLSIVEVGVRHRPRAAGQSKVSLADIPRTLAVLLPFWWSQVLFPARRAPAATVPTARRTWAGAAGLFLLAAVLLFSNLSYPLVEPDEGRYAEIGREMLMSGDWVIPTLNGRPYLDKPPLFYWLLASSFHVFGTTAGAARLVPAVAALLTVLATVAIGRRALGGRAALWSGLVLTLMIGFVQSGRFLILDSVLTLFVALALLAGHEAIRGRRLRWGWWAASATACALGVLTKGPVALVLLAPPVAAHAWLSGSRVRPSPWQWGGYAAGVLGLAAPWFLAVVVRRPEFAYDFLIDHHLRRFFTAQYHSNPVWFYVPVLLFGCLPWTMLLLPFTHFLLTRAAAARQVRSRALGFFLLWAGWCIVFFSLSRGKLPPYVLPAVPAIALLLGAYLEQVTAPTALADLLRRNFRLWPQGCALAMAASWVLINGAVFVKGLAGPRGLVAGAIMTGVCVAGVVAICRYGRRLPAKWAWAACAALAVGMVAQTTQGVVPAWSSRRSLLNQSGEVAALLRDRGNAVACVGEDVGAVPFELGRANVRDFDYQPGSALAEFLRAHARTVLVVAAGCPNERVYELMPAGVGVVRILDGDRARFVLVRCATAPADQAGKHIHH